MRLLTVLTLAPLALVPVHAWTNTTSTIVSTYTPPPNNYTSTSSSSTLNYTSTASSKTGPSPSTSPTTVSNMAGKVGEGLSIVALVALGGIAGLL